MGVLTMTPSIFSPRPVQRRVLVVHDSTAEVIEGCVDGEGKSNSSMASLSIPIQTSYSLSMGL